MSKAVLDTDIFSEVLRAVNVTVIGHAQTYRQAHGRLTLSVITVMEMVKGFQKMALLQTEWVTLGHFSVGHLYKRIF